MYTSSRRDEDLPPQLGEEKHRLLHHAFLKSKLAASLLFGLALIVLSASLAPFPFPFVKRPWAAEVWGLYGIINSTLLFFVASRLESLRVAYVFEGLGLFLFDQARLWGNVVYLHQHDAMNQTAVIYLFASTVIAVLGTVILLLALSGIIRYRIFKRTYQKADELAAIPGPALLALPAWLVLYSGMFTGLVIAGQDATLKVQSVMKFGGLIAFFLSFWAIGNELDRWHKKGKMGWYSAILILLHILFLIFVLVGLERYIPVISK